MPHFGIPKTSLLPYHFAMSSSARVGTHTGWAAAAAASTASRRGARENRRQIGRHGSLARILLFLVVAGLTTACRPENTSYSAASIRCADAMRIHLKGENVPKILRFSERDEGMRAQILFELTDLDEQSRQSAAACAFKKDEQGRLVLIGASLNGRVLDKEEVSRLADLSLRGVQ